MSGDGHPDGSRAVALGDAAARYAEIRDDALAVVDRALSNGAGAPGPECEALEIEIAARTGAGYAVGCASGADALALALMAIGVKSGDEVVTASFGPIAASSAVARLGARPVLVDVEPETLALDPALVEPHVTWRTKAILPLHVAGLPADVERLREIADLHGVAIVEDATEAFGAARGGRNAGALGHAAALAFAPDLALGVVGSGGAVVTADVELAEKVRMLADHGMRPRGRSRFLGFESRLDELRAAILRLELERFDAWQAARRDAASRYESLFAAAGLGERVALPPLPVDSRAALSRYVVRVDARMRDALRERLEDAGVEAEAFCPHPIHLQEAFRALGHAEGAFPESERAARETLALPIHAHLTAEMQEAVVARIATFFDRA